MIIPSALCPKSVIHREVYLYHLFCVAYLPYKDLSVNARPHIAFTGDNYNYMYVNVEQTDIQIGLIPPPCPLLITHDKKTYTPLLAMIF